MESELPPEVKDELEQAAQEIEEQKQQERREATKYGAQIESEGNDDE